MNYSLVVDGSKSLPCSDYQESEVFYTARTLSKHTGGKVDVYKNESYIGSFVYGKNGVKYEVVLN